MKQIKLDLTQLIGKTEEEAMTLVNAAGGEIRLTQKDGINYMGTCDLRFDRVNIKILKGLITKADLG